MKKALSSALATTPSLSTTWGSPPPTLSIKIPMPSSPLPAKTCPQCGNLFTPNRKPQLFCGKSCSMTQRMTSPSLREALVAATKRSWSDPASRAQRIEKMRALGAEKRAAHEAATKPLVCLFCKTSFRRAKKTATYCSRSCKARHQCILNPQGVLAASKRLKSLMSDPQSPLRRKLEAQFKAGKSPLQDPKIRAANHARQRGKPFPSKRGGNGSGMTKPQERLYHLLGPDWEAEACLWSEPRASTWPIMLVDLVNRKTRLVIEVDGPSHASASVKTRDRRKEILLRERGWKLLRVTNSEALSITPTSLFQALLKASGPSAQPALPSTT